MRLAHQIRSIFTGRILHLSLNFMLTRREVIAQLKRIGIKDPSLRKFHLQDFEEYMERNYGFKIGQGEKIRLKTKERPKLA
jgi:hypothetical protein